MTYQAAITYRIDKMKACVLVRIHIFIMVFGHSKNIWQRPLQKAIQEHGSCHGMKAKVLSWVRNLLKEKKYSQHGKRLTVRCLILIRTDVQFIFISDLKKKSEQYGGNICRWHDYYD